MKNNMYKKIFYSFSIIIVLYTVLILFVFISKEVSRQKYESFVEVEFYLEEEITRIDAQIEKALDSTRVLAENEEIQKLGKLNENDYGIYSSVFDQMKNNVFSGYQLDYNLGVCQGDGKTVVGLNGYFDFDDYLQFIGIPKDHQEVRDFFEKDDLYHIRVVCINQNLYLLRKIYQVDDPNSLYFIVNWNKESLNKMKNFYSTGRLFFYDSEAKTNPLGGSTEEIAPFLPLIQTKQSKIDRIIVDDNICFWKYSSVMPSLNYIYVIPNDSLSHLPMDTLGTIGVVLAALLLLGSLLAIYFSRSNYGPYRKIIYEIQKDEPDVIDVEGVLKKIEDLKNNNVNFDLFQETNLEDIREVFFKNVLLGKYPAQETERIASVVGLGFLKYGGVIAMLTIEGKAANEELLSNQELQKARQRIIKYGTDTTDIDLYIQPINANRFALIYATKAQNVVLEKIEKLRELLENELHVSTQFVLSIPFEDIDDFSWTFRDVFSLNSENIFKPQQIIVNRTVDKKISYDYSIETEQRLLFLVKSKQVLEATLLIESILKSNFLDKKLTSHSEDDFKHALINTVKRITQAVGIEYNKFYEANNELFSRLITNDPRELTHLFLLIFKQVFVEAEKYGKENYDIINRLLDYINCHYKEDLSLSDLSSHFHLTESYISKLIKDETGINFKNYINQLKVSHAKELLKDRTLMVSEVAEAVGVKNVNTFIRIFKKYEGVTPGKFQACADEMNDVE